MPQKFTRLFQAMRLSMAYSVKAVLRSVCWILQKKPQRYFWSTRIVWYNYPFTADASADFWPLLQCREHALNAGVDLNGYRPVTFDELIENNCQFKTAHAGK